MSEMFGTLKEIEKDTLLHEILNLKKDGYRFASMTCEQVGDNAEITYHMDKEYKLVNIRILSPLSEKVDSISSIYASAFLIENEFQDLYGIKFDALTIDYNGTLYMTPGGPKTPMVDKN